MTKGIQKLKGLRPDSIKLKKKDLQYNKYPIASTDNSIQSNIIEEMN